MNTLLKSTLAILLLSTGAKSASVTFELNVNTSALASTDGFLDFQFNPGSLAPSDYATVLLSNFTSDGSLTSAFSNFGSVTGTLPGTVEIDNTGVYNDYNESFSFASYFDVFVTLNIPTITGEVMSGSSFALGIYGSDDMTPALNADPLVEIDLGPNGEATVYNNSPNGEATVSATPEPASFLLAIGAFGGFLVIFRRRDRPQCHCKPAA